MSIYGISIKRLLINPYYWGGAYGSPAGDFQAGMYVKQGITFTSRGCNNHCKFCFVPEREGKIREIPIVAGNIVQDNNILQCSENHIGAVFEMLQTQRAVEFRGGLEAAKMTPFFAEQVTKLQQQHRLRNIWVAADTWGEVKPLRKALEMLKDAGFIVNNSFVQCYTISYGKPEQRQEDEERFKTVFEMGVMPRVQLFRAATREKTKYPIEVEQWARSWQRPAIIKAKMKAR